MNIKLLDSWIRDYLHTDATPKQIAERLSLTSVGIERVEKWKDDFQYDIEITTNRPDLASVLGIAREASAVLPQSGIKATFTNPTFSKPKISKKESIEITYEKSLVHRICAVIMEVSVKASPEKISNRLEASDIRSLNNVIDVTNYVMRTIGHPAHVFDFDKLTTKKLHIRTSKKGEKITTLDGKTYTLPGGDIVADDGKGTIVDLLAIMGLQNSVVSENTKRILFFVNNNEIHHIRKTSMALGIRTEAAQLNEKGVDPESAMDALLFGIKLYEDIADGNVISELYDFYPNALPRQTVEISFEKINKSIGITIPQTTSIAILKDLGFSVKPQKESVTVGVPSFRARDIRIPEDIVEEVARVYGYHKIPSIIPSLQPADLMLLEDDEFFWEMRIKQALKYWGFTEVYSYPMVSSDMYQDDTKSAVMLSNPLGDEFAFMRKSLTPGLLRITGENKRYASQHLFEIGNVYLQAKGKLPNQIMHLSGIIKDSKATFFNVKGVIEQLCSDLGIHDLVFQRNNDRGMATLIQSRKETLGEILVHDKGLVSFELNFAKLSSFATRKKSFKGISKFPPVLEDLTIEVPKTVTIGEVINVITQQSKLIKRVSLKDKYHASRTFHIMYQDSERNLTATDIAPIRGKIAAALREKLSIRVSD